MNERLFNEKFIFRLSYISLIFIPLILFAVGQKTDLFLFKIPAFLYFSIIIFTGIYSYSNTMVESLSKKEDHLYNLNILSFHPIIRFLIMITVGLTFVYYGYSIFGFLIIFASGGEITLHRKLNNLYDSE